MNSIEIIKDELDELETRLKEFVRSDIPLATEISQYIVGSGGKRIRPTLCILTAKALSYKGKELIDLSAAIELLHTATLIHDDVVDESLIRRGKDSVQIRWSNAHGVLVGDFVYSKAFQLMAGLKEKRLIEELSNSTNKISEGEVLQLSLKEKPNFSEKEYFEVIGRKTAELFKASVVTACILSKANGKVLRSLEKFSYNLGIAFQIRDDLLDYVGKEDKIGKKLGKDFEEGKITLPIVRAIELSNEEDKRFLKDNLSKRNMKNFDKTLDLIINSGAIDEVKEEEDRLVKECLNDLKILSPSKFKDALSGIVKDLLNRDR
ncbi:MAG: polyprenyl synthetase family protein [Gammaproteobacteria bacterium]